MREWKPNVHSITFSCQCLVCCLGLYLCRGDLCLYLYCGSHAAVRLDSHRNDLFCDHRIYTSNAFSFQLILNISFLKKKMCQNFRLPFTAPSIRISSAVHCTISSIVVGRHSLRGIRQMRWNGLLRMRAGIMANTTMLMFICVPSSSFIFAATTSKRIKSNQLN